MAIAVMRPIIGIAAEEQSKVGFDLTRFGMGIALKEHIAGSLINALCLKHLGGTEVLKTKCRNRLGWAATMMTAAVLLGVAATTALAQNSKPSKPSKAFINNFSTVTQGTASTPAAGPEAGDQNPYGVAVIPRTVGKLVKGNILVSNFNNAGSPPTGNLQGTGTSIVQHAPDV